MFIHEAIRLKLLADAGVSAITTRIYPGVLSQSVTYPAIAYRITGKDPVLKLEERGRNGLARFSIRFFSTTDRAHGGYDTAKNLDDAIRLCLEGFRGSISNDDSPIETVEIDGIFHSNTFDGYEDRTETFQVLTEYDVWAEEEKPS